MEQEEKEKEEEKVHLLQVHPNGLLLGGGSFCMGGNGHQTLQTTHGY